MKFTTFGSALLLALVSLTSAGSFYAGRHSNGQVEKIDSCEAAHIKKLCSFKPGDFIENRLKGWQGIVTSVRDNGSLLNIRISFYDGSTQNWIDTAACEWKHEDCDD